MRRELCKLHGIFTLTATQFQNNRVVIPKKESAPTPLKLIILTQQLLCSGLQQGCKGLILFKFIEFVLCTHIFSLLVLIPIPATLSKRGLYSSGSAKILHVPLSRLITPFR